MFPLQGTWPWCCWLSSCTGKSRYGYRNLLPVWIHRAWYWHKLAFCGLLWSEISYYWYVDLCSSNLSVLKTEINMFKGIQYCDNKPDVAVMLSYKYHTVSYSVFRVVCGYAMFLTFVINNGILQVHFHMQNASSVVRWDIYQGHVLTIPKDCMPKVSAVFYCSWNIFFLLTRRRTK